MNYLYTSIKIVMGFTIFSNLIFTSQASAQARANSTEQFEQKTKLEKVITERMEKAIGVSLERNSFDVSVNVQIFPVPLGKKDDENTASSKDIKKPEDFSMGLIDAEELLKNYQNEIAALKIAKANADKSLKEGQYDVKEISIAVGLIDSFDETYVEEFKTWLTKKVKSEFGPIGKVSVGKIKKNPETLKPISPFVLAKELQGIFSALLAVLGLIVCVLMIKAMRNKESEDQKTFQLQMSGQQSTQAGGEGGSNKDKKTELSMFADMKNMKDLMGKVVALITRSDLDINKVIETWLDNGGDGMQKTACMFDALLSGNVGFKNDDDAIELLKSIHIPDTFKPEVASTLSSMRELRPDAKTVILESAYWDLLSFQTIGDQFLKQPFAYTTSVKPAQLRDILMSQKPRDKAITLLTMPEKSKHKLLSELNPDEKKEIFTHALDVNSVQKKEIEDLSESIKKQIQSTNNQIEVVTQHQMLPSLLSALNPIDEIRMILEAATNKPSELLEIKKLWPTLAFFKDWKVEYQKLYLSRCSNEQIEIMARFLQSSQESILNGVSPRVKEIVSDTLKISSPVDETLLSTTLKELRDKLLALFETKEIKFADLYADTTAEVSVTELKVA